MVKVKTNVNKELKRDIRKIIVDSVKTNLDIQKDLRIMQFDAFFDLGMTELDMHKIILDVEEELGVNLDDESFLESTNLKLLDLVSHYNEEFYNIVSHKTKE